MYGWGDKGRMMEGWDKIKFERKSGRAKMSRIRILLDLHLIHV